MTYLPTKVLAEALKYLNELKAYDTFTDYQYKIKRIYPTKQYVQNQDETSNLFLNLQETLLELIFSAAAAPRI
jgi:hypothetical protein